MNNIADVAEIRFAAAEEVAIGVSPRLTRVVVGEGREFTKCRIIDGWIELTRGDSQVALIPATRASCVIPRAVVPKPDSSENGADASARAPREEAKRK